MSNGRIAATDGSVRVSGGAVIAPGRWTHVAAVADGRSLVVYVDGRTVASRAGRPSAVAPRLAVAPTVGTGQVLMPRRAISADRSPLPNSHRIRADPARSPRRLPHGPILRRRSSGTSASAGPSRNRRTLGSPSSRMPGRLPRARGDATTPPAIRTPLPPAGLAPARDGRWIINGWQLAAAPEVREDAATLSRPGSVSGTWRPATVPARC